jgi:hypothetical protein
MIGRYNRPLRNSSRTFIFVPALPTIHILGLAHGVECLTFALVSIRGLAFAAYTLSEKILGVDLWHYWTDHTPAQKESIIIPADLNIQSGSPTFQFVQAIN